MDIGNALATYVREHKIPIFGIADASGFAHALPGWHPHEVMPLCKSVVVFGRPFIEHPLRVEEKTHLANDSWWETNASVSQEIARWRGDIVNLLDTFGLGAANVGGFGPSTEPTLSYRLAQYEAGVGVYGRFGACLNPEFGCYYAVGVLLTDAELPPSDQDRLKDFAPCEGCAICADVCPVRAIDASSPPERANNQALCLRFVWKMKGRHSEEVKVCSRCFSACPWSKASPST